MNKKLIAVAVASVVAAPAAYADITAYGRVNNAIEIKDDGDRTTDISGVGGRFGFKGSSDLGNGISAIGRYEFSTTTDKEGSGVGDTRLAYVGMSGGFGTVQVGNMWSSYYNTIGTHMSPTYSLGYYLYSSVAGGPFRTSNTIQYSNSFGPVSLSADIRANDSGEGNDVAEKLKGDGYGLGISITPMENITIALATDSDDDGMGVDAERIGIAAQASFGSVSVKVGHQEMEHGANEVDHQQLYVSAGLTDQLSMMIGAGQADTGTTEPSSTFLGAYYNMGGGLRLWLESTNVDYDDGEEVTRTYLGMRFDF